ncbi:carbohydrate ABC transporter permease [Microvirga pudoricolor]|uniref:carbohydrate ABC transporter permease n=1 Tax=Microvirga pudoricolor TaxID=2778729 RepID=UPI00194F3F28|nr:carbohydrate ABC transporter permease [Microvirga pudoricolor]MBM6593595.1 carbohydrate ABC transporter permease [Microvirga pudoricolor]
MTMQVMNPTESRVGAATRSMPLASYFGTLLMLALLAIVMTPVLWAVLSAFKTRSDIFAGDVWPRNWSTESFRDLLSKTLYVRWMVNSLFVAFCSTALGLFFCSLGGYAFAKFDFPGKTFLFWVVIASVSIPPFTTVIPLFGWLARLGLLDTYLVLILPFAANAFGIFLMRQYAMGVPNELLDAGRIDGCGEFRLYWSVVLPLLRPALGTVGILIFIASWNSYIWPLVMMRSDQMLTLPVGVASLKGDQLPEYGMLMAASVLSSLPIILAFFAMQRQFIAGLTQGAVK